VLPGVVHAKQAKFYDDLLSVYFSSEKDGWACGRWGTALYTADGGKTWVRQNTGTDYTLTSIYFVDAKIGWAVGDEGTIIHTKDGGKTWEKQKCPVKFFLMNVFFLSPEKGFIVTEKTHILSTNDGGKTWNVKFKDEDYILKAISFADSQNGWVVGEFGYIYHTNDGGETWKKQGGFSDLSEDTGELIGGTYLFNVVAVDPKTAWAVGIEGYISRTNDGGKTWQQVITEVPKTQLFCVASDKAGTLAIGGKGIFLISTDRGQSWKKVDFKPPITYGWIYGVAKRGNAGFVAVGKAGAIYLSALDSWRRVNE
jgi:photosystem II stability/assembly factor-like uncharacterized protein